MTLFNCARFFLQAFVIATLSLIFAAAADAQCETDAETALYNSFLANYKGTPQEQKAAYVAAKDYVAKYGTCPSDAEKKVTDFVQKWMAKYELAVAEYDCTTAVSATPDKAFDLCQPYVAKDAENLKAYLLLTFAGAKTGKTTDSKIRDNTLQAARKTLAMIAAGKTTDNWIFGKEQADAVGAVNYYAGFYLLDTAPAEAQTYFVNAAKTTGTYAKEPAVYDALARAIYNNEYKTAATDYNVKCSTNPVSECDALYAKAGQVLDKVIDAYARAVALGKDSPSVSAAHTNLIAVYKVRHDNSDVGLDKLLAEVLLKPLP